MPSFDIVCEINSHELTNALDQANREIGNRFDFKGVDARYTLRHDTITMVAEVDFQLHQMLDILRNKLTKRAIDIRHLKVAESIVQHKKAEQLIALQQGISQDLSKKIIKLIKDKKMKVQAAIQGSQIRVTAKKRDDLQSVIALVEAHDFGLPLQCGNYRD